MPYTTPLTPVNAAHLMTAAEIQAWSDSIIFLASMLRNNTALSALSAGTEINAYIGARAHNDATISINDSTWTNVTFNTEGAAGWDTNNIHNVSSNTQNFVVPIAGRYICKCEVLWAGNSTGIRALRILNDASQIAEEYEPNPGVSSFSMSVDDVANCVAGGTIVFQAYQTSGGALNLTNAGTYGIHASVSFLGV